MLQRSSPLSRLPRAARREIAMLLATDPDTGDSVEQESYALDDHLDAANQINLKQMLDIGFCALTPQEERVLRLRYGLAGVGCHTYREIADLLDITFERVRQLELRAHRKLIKRWISRGLWNAADTTRRDANVAARPPKPYQPVGPYWDLHDDAHGRPLPSPVPHAPAAELADIPEKPHAAAHAKPAALHVVPRPSLWSRMGNWVPGGRVAHGEFSLDSLFSSRRR